MGMAEAAGHAARALVTATEPVRQGGGAAWVGWASESGPESFREDGPYLRRLGLSPTEIAEYYEGFRDNTLWPIIRDVIVQACFHRNWWKTYRTPNHRFAQAIAQVAAPGATVWVHDYQLQRAQSGVLSVDPSDRGLDLFAQHVVSVDVLARERRPIRGSPLND
jgi:Trehalose-6-phosphate synthase